MMGSRGGPRPTHSTTKRPPLLKYRVFVRHGLIGASALAALSLAPVPGVPGPVARSENPRYAAIVMDATTGEVLFARFADETRYPASITKVMTLYLAFEALAEGRARLDEMITVSPKAAAQAPSKLGLQPGQQISLDDAMRATAIRSCNDMAMAIAEHLGGSEAGFTDMMTRKARALGMTRSRYFNPNGLPDSRQTTTARDLAILSRAVMRDYPQYYRYFGLHDWSYDGRSFRSTNGLLTRGEGYDGIKTGFTNASGYNLAASAVRDGKRLIAVVLGGRTSGSRNEHLDGLMNTGFELERLRERGERVQLTQAFFEARGYGLGSETSGPIQFAQALGPDGEDSDQATYASLPQRSATEVSYAEAASTTPPSPQVAPAAGAPRPAFRPTQAQERADLTSRLNGGGEAGRQAATSTTSRPARPQPTPPRPREPEGRWSVQVGAFRDEAVARRWLDEVNRRFRSEFARAERRVIASSDGWRRSRFIGLTEEAARGACRTLEARNVTCLVVRPEG